MILIIKVILQRRFQDWGIASPLPVWILFIDCVHFIYKFSNNFLVVNIQCIQYILYHLFLLQKRKTKTQGIWKGTLKHSPDTKTGSEIPGSASAYFGVFLCWNRIENFLFFLDGDHIAVAFSDLVNLTMLIVGSQDPNGRSCRDYKGESSADAPGARPPVWTF